MVPRNHPDRIQIAFDDHRLVANAGLILPATLALRLGLPQLLRKHLDLGGATYVHTDPDSDKNYYWVFACNSNGCSDTDSPNPATPIETRPNGPANVTHAFEGSAIRVTWEAVPGADYYKVYHDDFFDDVCSLRSDGSLGFCEELATNVVGTAYVHTSPNLSTDENYYWVVACNSGGCSEIESTNPARPR